MSTTYVNMGPTTELWYNALDQEIGLWIVTDDRDGLMNRLYAARQQLADPKLDDLMIFRPVTDGVLFIAKKSTELEP